MRVLLFVALLAAGSLAGCTDSTPEPSTEPTGTNGETADGLDMPTWSKGDWWQYQGPGNPFTLVVSDDAGSSWFIDTDDEDMAFFEIQFGPISYLGEQSKANLAGSQGSDAVKFFDWPLEDGKTWTTPWDGDTMDMVAHDLGNDAFHVIATVDGMVRNQFQYSNATKWFDWMSFNDLEGNEQFRMDLVDSGSAFAGELVRAQPELLGQAHHEGLVAQEFALFGNAGVLSATDADAYMFYNVQCQTGAFSFAMGTLESTTNIPADVGVFEDQGFSQFAATCPTVGVAVGTIGITPGNGDHWGVLVNSESPDLVLDYTLFLRHFERFTL